MAEATGIEWTWRWSYALDRWVQGATFNGWWGCTKASAGCRRCYAETLAHRFGLAWGPNAHRKPASEGYWGNIARWNRAAARIPDVRTAVFAFSMSDVMDGWVDRRDPTQVQADMQAAYAKAIGAGQSEKAAQNRAQEWRRVELDALRDRLWGEIERAPNLDFLLLTKRPENYIHMTPTRWVQAGVPSNVWLGCSTEDQEMANIRLLFLLEAQKWLSSPVVWISAEPLLGALDLAHLAYVEPTVVERRLRSTHAKQEARDLAERWHELWRKYISSSTNASWSAAGLLGWVITGGQSAGPNAEALVDQADPTLPLKHEALDWLRTVRDFCTTSGISYFHKQNGGPSPKVGGKAFDGREWCEYPQGTMPRAPQARAA
jgi:protein gp37